MVIAAAHDAFDYWSLAADWFVAAGTVSAVVVALWSGLGGARRERRRTERVRRNQAFLVEAEPVPTRTGDGAAATSVVNVANGSGSPVFGLRLEVFDPGDGTRGPVHEQTVHEIDYLLAGQQTRIDLTGTALSDTTRTRLFWTDDTGYRWVRQGVERPQSQRS